MSRVFDPGIDVKVNPSTMNFEYGSGLFGPKPEHRHLDAIRKSLRNPGCSGPEIVYSIAMDVGKEEHRQELENRMLLFGIVTYAAGKLGSEPIRSQGHIHRISSHSGWSPPEIYEIWDGEAVIYMQETAKDDPGRCFAVYAEPGDVVIVPPGWAHATISANPELPLTFGAWCDREYGFEYDEIRARQGLAWYPLLDKEGRIVWEHNDHYKPTELVKKRPADYARFGIDKETPIYRQFEQNPDQFQFVSKPHLKEQEWRSFTP
ncbi:glucose-6-phosphate isomerase [Melghirimyces profundicolus]|uniref:glucose-6-phosphate isomerase n=1 Tax=Melghirimyces profundicolus TaxID=1242148 RepID=A0A2T6C7Y5_9BACL|nr:glucose-6-phosphate isomerase family protein [Melghirimyces profundicolus]PTX64415.1 glucose-6-phosphate isomerase [Melghirimyces profundicolus]